MEREKKTCDYKKVKEENKQLKKQIKELVEKIDRLEKFIKGE